MNRAERRHRRQRAVAHAKRKLATWGKGWAERASWWADNMAKCSCDMCRNPPFVREPKLVWDGEIDDELA